MSSGGGGDSPDELGLLPTNSHELVIACKLASMSGGFREMPGDACRWGRTQAKVLNKLTLESKK